MELKDEAEKHFKKLEQSIAYHTKKLDEDIPKGAKHMHQMEVEALNFVMEYARKALTDLGVHA